MTLSSQTRKSLFILLALKDDASISIEQTQLNEYIENVIEFNDKNYENHNELYNDFIKIYENLYKLRNTVTFGSINGKKSLPKTMIKKIDDLLAQLEKINNEKIKKLEGT